MIARMTGRAALVACLAMHVSAEPPPTETITFTLEMVTEGGDPVPRVPIRVDSRARMHFGLTDEQGELALEVTREVGEQVLVARPSTGHFLWEDEAQKELALERFHALRAQYAFDRTTYVPIDGTGPYTGELVAYDAVTVSGRLVDEHGAPLRRLVAASSHAYVVSEEDGVFSLGGVRKGERASVYVAGAYSESHEILATTEPVLEDVELGNVVVTKTPTNATVTITVTDRVEGVGAADLIDVLGRVTLIRADARAFHGFTLGAGGRAYFFADSEAVFDLPIPAGEWFVTVGSEMLAPWTMLRDALRDGKAAELEAAGVPKLVIEPGEHIDVTISALDAWNALKSVVPEPGP